MADIFTTLQSRGFVADCTDIEGFKKLTAEKSVGVYVGFDPTSDSLTIGNLVPIMALKHFQLAGHKPIPVVGGATGMIGDPSGKSAERNLQSLDIIRKNMDAVRGQFAKVLDFSGPCAARIVNNHDWLSKFSYIDFLRDVGKHFRIGEMLGKESVRARINSDAGISYTEFSYMLLQAYDFKHLMEHEDCPIQAGGADQWGNIVAGIELIRKTLGKQAYGITFPLLMTASGQKLGKTEAGAVYLSATKTSVFEFYQYWVRADDRDADRFLKMFTLLELDEIAGIVRDHEAAPEKRGAQKRLAFEVTKLIHGEAEATKAREAAEALYETELTDLTDDKLRELFPDVPSVKVAAARISEGWNVAEALVEAKLAPSKKEASRLLQQGGLYVNNKPWNADRRTLTRDDLASETMILLRAGKKRYCLIQVEG